MKENLQNLGYFSAYVTNTVQNDTNGALTIINGDESESRLELYIDNEFIASGFGFPDKSSYTTALAYINNLGANVEDINNKIDPFQESIEKMMNSSLEYTYQDNIINAEYNNYGMILSYNYFELSYNKSNNVVSYTLQNTKKTNHNYIKDIKVKLSRENTEYYKTDNIPIDVTIIFNNSTKEGLENYQIKYSYCGTNIINNLDEYTISNNEYSNSLLGINNDETIRKEDLTISLLHKYKDSITDNNYYTIYSYIYKDIFNWKNKLSYSYNADKVNVSAYYLAVNNYDLNDYNISIENNAENNNLLYNNFKGIIDNSDFDTFYEYDKEIYLSFDNKQLLYDYIIIDSNVKIDFYFNGINPNPWIMKKVTITKENEPEKNYYIYQSPQRYIGKHTWTIKITKIE